MYCKICGTQNNADYCCANCDSLAYAEIRALPSGTVLIKGVPCGAIQRLLDEANNVVLYYGTLEKFPNVKTQVYTEKSDVLSALIELDGNNIVEIPE